MAHLSVREAVLLTLFKADRSLLTREVHEQRSELTKDWTPATSGTGATLICLNVLADAGHIIKINHLGEPTRWAWKRTK